MLDENSLEQFKNTLIAEYIDGSLNDMLDLRNAIKKARTSEEIRTLLQEERVRLLAVLGTIEEEKKDAA